MQRGARDSSYAQSDDEGSSNLTVLTVVAGAKRFGQGEPESGAKVCHVREVNGAWCVSGVASQGPLRGLAAYDRVEDLAFAAEVGHGETVSVQHAAVVNEFVGEFLRWPPGFTRSIQAELPYDFHRTSGI